MEKKIKIHITSMQSELGETFLSQLFEESDEDFAHSAEAVKEQIESDGVRAEVEGAKMESSTEGTLVIEGGRATVRYDETELTGMAGARSTVTYRTADRGLVSMIRSGPVSTAMTFKAHHRAICTYETPYMPFSIGIHALTVDNRLDTEGTLKLDYIIEIKGARAERCEMEMKIQEDLNA